MMWWNKGDLTGQKNSCDLLKPLWLVGFHHWVASLCWKNIRKVQDSQSPSFKTTTKHQDHHKVLAWRGYENIWKRKNAFWISVCVGQKRFRAQIWKEQTRCFRQLNDFLLQFSTRSSKNKIVSAKKFVDGLN